MFLLIIILEAVKIDIMIALSSVYFNILCVAGTVGRHAGIYRTGMMSQYGMASNPYAVGQQQQQPPSQPGQQMLVPGNRNHPSSIGSGAGGYASNSTGGPSRRSSSSSGNQPPRSAAPTSVQGYAPTGMHMAQQASQQVQQQQQIPPMPMVSTT